MSTRRPQNVNFRVDTKNLITVDSRRTEQTIHSVISSVRTRTNRHQMQMLILNRLRLKPDFSQALSLRTMMCLKAKSLSKKKRDITTNWKRHQENFDSQTKLRLTKPNNNMQSLDYITQYCVHFVSLEVT